jgi:hypothetical protein
LIKSPPFSNIHQGNSDISKNQYSLAYNGEGGEGIGTMRGKEKAVQMLLDTGFTNVQVKA